MSRLVTFIPRPGFDFSQSGVVKIDDKHEYDVHSGLQAGGGQIVLDLDAGTINSLLANVLHNVPGLQLSTNPPNVSPSKVPATPGPLNYSEIEDPCYGDLLARDIDGKFKPVKVNSGGTPLAQQIQKWMGGDERSILITNQMWDPRGVNPAYWGVTGGAGTVVVQNPTQRQDGLKQQASPKVCQEVIVTAGTGAANFISMASKNRLNGHGVALNLNRPFVAGRLAFKLSGNLGNAWTVQLTIGYYDSTGTFIGQVAVWSGDPSTVNMNTWYEAEGFDAQSLASATNAKYAEILLVVTGATSGNNVTIRVTEGVLATNSDHGDIPDYVGGDMPDGGWNGAADASTSYRQFDPSTVYPVKDFGINNYELSNAYVYSDKGPHTISQAIGMLRMAGCSVARFGTGFFQDNGVGQTPGILPAQLHLMQQYIAAGIKLIPILSDFPPWMAPTHLGLTQAGNAGGSISAGATQMNVTGSLPPNFPALPQPIKWNDGTDEVATLTALAGGVATIVRGQPAARPGVSQAAPTTAVGHADNTVLFDGTLGVGFSHQYYPDAAYRNVYAQAVLNMIQTLGPQNIYGVELWNEPNIAVDDTRNEGAAGYTALLNAIHDAVKPVYPTVKILGGAIAAQISSTPTIQATDPVTFLNGMFTAGAKYDELAIHLYPGTTAGAQWTPSSGPDWGNPANAGYSGFDYGLRRIKAALVANGAPSTPMFVTEFGILNTRPNERVQGQAGAAMLGRLLRDPQITGACWNGLAGASGKSSIFDSSGLRPRAVARQFARMRGRPPISFFEDIVRWSPASGRDEPDSLVDNVMPWTLQLFPAFSSGAAGDTYPIVGTWSQVIAASQQFGFLGYNTSNAQNDEFGFQVPLARGSWTMVVLFEKAATNSIVTPMLDGVAIGGATFDGYAAATAYNQVFRITFSVADSGLHIVSLKTLTRNASATGWTIGFSAMQLRRTA